MQYVFIRKCAPCDFSERGEGNKSVVTSDRW